MICIEWKLSPLVVLVALACAASARAQLVSPGSHVRIAPMSGAKPLEGSLVVMDADSLRLRLGLGSTQTSIAMDSVRTIDVGEGVRARHGAVLRGTAIGMALGIGAAVGATKFGCATNYQSGDGGVPCELGYVVFGVPLAIAGAVIGAHIAKNHKSEQWDRVFDRARMTSLLIGPTPHHGFAIGLSIPLGGGAAAP